MVVDDAGSNLLEIKDPQKLKENVSAMTKGVLGTHFLEGLRHLGTPQIVMITQTAGALPTKNFTMGQFDKAESLSGEYMEELLKKQGECGNRACLHEGLHYQLLQHLYG